MYDHTCTSCKGMILQKAVKQIRNPSGFSKYSRNLKMTNISVFFNSRILHT